MRIQLRYCSSACTERCHPHARLVSSDSMATARLCTFVRPCSSIQGMPPHVSGGSKLVWHIIA